MNLPAFPDDCFKVDVRPALLRQPMIKGRSRLSTSFTDFVRFEGALDNVGYRAVFAARKPVREITRLCASYRKLRLGHIDLLFQ
ncbi:hypothetical protein AOG23_27375 [Rhizobium acidisoli]|nr:hypothetical protein AOG23_27375 [Rhizobium acidisoli]